MIRVGTLELFLRQCMCVYLRFLGRGNCSGHWRPWWKMICDDNDGQMIFGDLGGLKLPDMSYRWGKTPKKPHPGNLSRPGIEPGPAAWQARMLPPVPQRWTFRKSNVRCCIYARDSKGEREREREREREIVLKDTRSVLCWILKFSYQLLQLYDFLFCILHHKNRENTKFQLNWCISFWNINS